METSLSVLLYVPLAPSEERLHPETWRCLQRLQWPGALDVVLGREDDPAEAHHYDNLVKKHNQARRLVLEGGYDALFLVEADMLVPPDALIRLARADADVVYGLYCSRHESKERGGYRWLAFWHAGPQRSMTYCARPAVARAAWGKVVTSHGVGLGCTLIHRRVLETIHFRPHVDHKVADDWMFALECQGHGFRQVHDMGVVCGHILGDQGATRAIWPDPREETLWRIESL